jgi:hypothetical protein
VRLPLREAAWLLHVSFSVLNDWDRGFDENFKPFKVPDNRGKGSRITIETVRTIVGAAEELQSKGRRIRIKSFAARLAKDHDLHLSSRKVQEVLIANDLFRARTRKKRPKYYRSLRKEIPNGLLSLDGSKVAVRLDGEPEWFNVELAVDVKTFAHTAFSIGDEETSEGVIETLEAHRKEWGDPLGMLCDHRSGNLSEATLDYLRSNNIELVPAGPSNPKGNGTDEGAFSQLKQALGPIRLDLSSARSLAKGVLEHLVSLYVKMRNRIPVKENPFTPCEGIKAPVSEGERDRERRHLKSHVASKVESEEDRRKVERIKGMVDLLKMDAGPEEIRNAERTIKFYGLTAVEASEEAFVKAVNRKPERKNLSYFFGILRRIQQEKDDAAYGDYCRRRYNEEVMQELQRQQEDCRQEKHSMEEIIKMLVQSAKMKIRYLREVAERKARQWTEDLMKSYAYPGSLKKRFIEALGGFTELSLEQKERICGLLERFLEPENSAGSVTRFS